MEPEEIHIFAKEVYRQCVDKGMTCGDFGLFAAFIRQYKESALTEVRYQVDKTPLPSRD